MQKKRSLEQLLARSSERELNSPAFLKSGMVGTYDGDHLGGGKLQFNALFSDDEVGATQLLIANRDYWRTNQAKAAPQLITLIFSFNPGDVGSVAMKAELAEKFPIEKLQEMLDK